jgi:phosphoribosylglycinamide formyltransferase 2
VPEIEAIATPMLEELEAQGLVRVIPTARAARLTMDREGIRRLAAESLRLPTSPYRFCDSLAELQAAIDGGIGYPCIVKPVMSSSGKGQSKIDGPADVQRAWEHAMAGGRVSRGRVIVEGFIDFDYEITLLTVRSAGGRGEIETSFCEPIGHIQVSGDYVESWQPHPMAPLALERAREISESVTDNLGGLGLFGVELFVKGDQVWFSEVSPRPHDTGMVTMATQWQNEFELHARAILGLPVDTTLKSPGASAVIYGGVEAAGIVFDGAARARHRAPPVRQAGELHEAAHGRRAGPRPGRSACPHARQAGGGAGAAAGGLTCDRDATPSRTGPAPTPWGTVSGYASAQRVERSAAMGLIGWIVVAVLAAAAGAAVGWTLAARRTGAGLLARAEAAEQQLKEEAARAASRLAAQEAQARKDIAAVQDEMLARLDRLKADHRAETEKLSGHLTEAYDELDRLRLRAAAAPQPPDTGQGFPATMPLGDL